MDNTLDLGTLESSIDDLQIDEFEDLPSYMFDNLPQLDLPPHMKIPGYQTAFIALSVNGKPTTNFVDAWRMGWRPLSRKDYPVQAEHYMGPLMPGHSEDENIQVNEQLWMKIPIQIYKKIQERKSLESDDQMKKARMFNKFAEQQSGSHGWDKSTTTFGRTTE